MRVLQQHVTSQPINKQWVRGELPTYKTKVVGNDQGQRQVVFHQTAVVSFDLNRITLDTGGWWTRTTKMRMNQAGEAFGLGYHVYQKGGEWFVQVDDEHISFEDDVLHLNRNAAQD